MEKRKTLDEWLDARLAEWVKPRFIELLRARIVDKILSEQKQNHSLGRYIDISTEKVS